jgi:hypothetical protein
MYDPLRGTDPLDDLLDPFGGFSMRRPPAFPALPEAEARGLAGTLTDGALSGLGYVGSVLDKTFGGRALRGLLGGHTDELKSLIPFSDSVGWTDPTRAVSGEDLLNHLGYHPERGTWAERNLAGPAAEIALDPGTYLTLGSAALTKAGQAAKAAGTLERGLAPGIRAGQRALATVAGVPLGTGEIAAKAAGYLDRAGEAIKYAPGVRQARSLFDPLAGPQSDALVQKAHEFAGWPEKERLLAETRGLHEDLVQQVRPAVEAGADPDVAAAYLRARALGLPEATIDRLVPGRAGLAPHLGTLDPVADRLKQFRDSTFAAEQQAGIGTRALGDDFLDYYLRRSTPAPANPLDTSRLFQAKGASQAPRKKVLRDLPGGDLQIEKWIGDPALRAADPKQRAAAIEADIRLGLQEAGAGPAGIPYSPRYLDRTVPRKARSVGDFVASTDIRHADPTAPVPFFNQDVLGDLLARGERSATVRSSAAALYDVASHAEPVAGPGRTSLLDVIKGGQLGGVRGSAPAATRAAVEHMLHAVGQDPATLLAGVPPEKELATLRKALAPYTLPEATAKAATTPMQRFVTPTEVKPALDLYDRGLGIWKDLLYTVWPASHVRNAASAGVENALTSGTRPAAYAEAHALRSGRGADLGIAGLVGTPDEQRLALFREATAHGVVKRGQGQFGTDRVSQPTTLLEGLRASPSQPRGFAFSDVPGALRHPVQSGRDAGQAVEDTVRMAQYADLRRKGYVPAEAAKVVESTHFDYSRSADFEKSFMKRVVPFYSFSRRNLPKQLRRAATEPGKVGIPIRAGTAAGSGEEGYVPEYLRSGFAIPIGEGGPDGTQRFLSKLGIPVEEAFGGLKVGTGPLDTLTKTAESAVGSMTPPVKMLVEGLTGRQSFTGRKLSDLRPTSTGMLGGLLDEDDPRARLLTQVVGNSPLSRAASTVDKLVDERKGVVPKALNLLTGLRISDVDAEKYRAIDARNRLDQLLEGVPGVSSYERKYVRPEDKGKITPDLEEKIRLQQNLAEKAKAAAKAKRDAERWGGPAGRPLRSRRCHRS